MKEGNIPGYPNFYKLVGLKSQGRISRIINKYSSVGLE